MSLVHSNSCECAKSELDLFAVPATQTSVEDGHWHHFGPISTITESGPYEFSISGSGEDYIDLGNTNLYVVAQIVQKADGSDIDAGANVGPVNLWLHSLFSDVTLSLNGKLVSGPTNAYPYRAYIETLLSYGPAAKQSYLTSALWYKDAAGHMGIADNSGFNKRKAATAESATVEMMGKLHCDLFAQDRYLVNNVDVSVKLTRSKNEFCLMGDANDYKVKIEEIYLIVRKVKLSSSVLLAHAKALEKTPVKYPITRVQMKKFSISKGSMNYVQENLFLGQMPKRVVIGCVDTDAFHGIHSKNPFNFKHYQINFLALNMDGKQIPSQPLQPKFNNSRYIRSYLGLFSATGKMNEDEGNNISRTDYGKGFTLFAFDLTPDLSDIGTFQLSKEGHLRLEIQFTVALENAINVIVYGEFDNIIEIDRNRQLLFDYSV